MKKGLVLGLAVAAMAGAASAEQQPTLTCDKPLELVGMEMNQDGVVFIAHNDGLDPIRFVIDGANVSDGTITLDDLVQEGVVSQGMSDFMRSDLQAGMVNQTEMLRTGLLERFDDIQIFMTPRDFDVRVSVETAEGASIERSYDFNTEKGAADFESDYAQYNGVSDILEISQMLKNTMIGHGQVASECNLSTGYVSLRTENGMLRPQARPEIKTP